MHKRLYSLIILILFFSSAVKAQYLSAKGDFSVDQQRGCYDLTVTVTKLDPTPGPAIYLFEGFSGPTTTNNFFTYTTPGDYWLFQIIQAGTGDKVDSLLIQILEPVIPAIELQTCSSNSLQIQINDTNYDSYEIDYGDGSPSIQQPVNTTPVAHSYAAAGTYNVTVSGIFSTAFTTCGVFSTTFSPVPVVQPAYILLLNNIDDNFLVINYNLAPNSISKLEISVNNDSNFQVLKDLAQGTVTDTIMNLNLSTTTYCFRITTNDACSNQQAFSNSICSVSNALNINNNAMALNWITYIIDNNQVNQVLRNNNPLASLPATATSFSDTTALCGTNYCYGIMVNYPNGSLSLSSTQCGIAISTNVPATATDISSINSETQVVWQWLTDTANLAYTNIYKINQNGQVQLLDSTQQTNYTYIRSDTLTQCIYLINVNRCGNVSAPSLTACPLNLSGIANNNGSVTLNWNAYQGWQAGVLEYIVVILDQSGNLVDSIMVGTNTTYTDPLDDAVDQASTYLVYAIPQNSSVPNSRSQQVEIERLPVIAIPNVFTPNGDGLNDSFQATGRFIASVDIAIFNRWGNSIYHSDDIAGWNGQVKGKPATVGNYTYKLNIKDFLGNTHIRTGTILILSD